MSQSTDTLSDTIMAALADAEVITTGGVISWREGRTKARKVVARVLATHPAPATGTIAEPLPRLTVEQAHELASKVLAAHDSVSNACDVDAAQWEELRGLAHAVYWTGREGTAPATGGEGAPVPIRVADDDALDSLTQRLRGEYRTPITDGLGPAGGEEPDNAREFVRRFPVPPIQAVAAGQIDALRAEHDTLIRILTHGDAAHDTRTLRNVWEQKNRVVEQACAVVAGGPDVDSEAWVRLQGGVRELLRITLVAADEVDAARAGGEGA